MTRSRRNNNYSTVFEKKKIEAELLNLMNFDLQTYISKAPGVLGNPGASVCSSLNGCLFTVETALLIKNANTNFLNHKK